MRSDSIPDGRTFIEQARRRQIVDSTIDVIARRGLSQASLALIAREVGCSKGVISYHFEGKDDLIEAILHRLIREPIDFIKQRVDACQGAMDKLRAYVSANVEFMGAHRSHYVALVDLWGSQGWEEGRNRFDVEVYQPRRAYLSKILEAGQAAGELAPRPPLATASLIQGALDGVMLQWVCDPAAVDLDAARTEILDMLAAHLAVRDGNPR